MSPAHHRSAATSLGVVVLPDARLLAESTASRLLLTIVDAQSVSRPLHLVLTGGSGGIATLAAARRSPLLGAVDWTGVHLWWGDERFLPTGDPDRNETQAREALLDHVPVPADHVHPMPGPDAVGSPEESAEAYAAELARFAADGRGSERPSGAAATPVDGGGKGGEGGERPSAAGATPADGRGNERPSGAEATPVDGGGEVGERPSAAGTTPADGRGSERPSGAEATPVIPAVPAFDLVMLGVGPDGHVASLFPGLPGVREVERTVIGVRDSPKPPPERVSLTVPAIGQAREVWLIAAGTEKAGQIARALSGRATADDVPASAVRGRVRTLWLLDAAAADAAPSGTLASRVQ